MIFTKHTFLIGVSASAVCQLTGLVLTYTSDSIISMICISISIVITVCLGLYWFGFSKKLEDISCKFEQDEFASGKISKYPIVETMVNTFNKSLTVYKNKINDMAQSLGELHIQLRLIERQKHDADGIIYSIRDAVIVIDASEKIQLANDAAAMLFGFDIKTIKGMPIDGVINCNEFIELIRKSRQSKTRHIKHEITVHKNDSARIYDCIISCIYDDNAQVQGVVAVLHDITREKEISQMKNDFVSHVSHELKTPLASITAYAEMLVDGEASDEQTRAEFYSIIQSQAQRLNRLIEDILNISRIESGLVKVNKEYASMALLVRDAVQMIKSYAAEKNITVIEQATIVFDQVYIDKDMISQVIINLLSNAVKYTPAGGKIIVKTETNESDGVVRISVIDTGVGIPDDEIGKVFDKFYRVKANNKCAKGTGLGLNLVKQIVEKVHNGRAFVESKVGQGSTFGFEMPLAANEADIAAVR